MPELRMHPRHPKQAYVRDARNPKKILGNLPLIIDKLNQKTTQLGSLELHLTDLCDLACWYCTYRDKNRDTLPFPCIKKLLKFKPKAITIVGGGEPTLYKYKKYRFNDVIALLRESNIKCGLITNGTYIPRGEWQNYIDWIRISLDAATPETYFILKGKDWFDKVLQKVKTYLRGPIPNIGLGYLFQKENIMEIPDFVKIVFGLDEKNRDKINVQFRPIRGYSHALPTPEQSKIVYDKLMNLKEESDEMCSFLEDQTNYGALKYNPTKKTTMSNKCYFNLIYTLVRANGDLYPCCTAAEHHVFCQGNILKDSIEQITLNQFEMYNMVCPKRDCTGSECIKNNMNLIAEETLYYIKHSDPFL